jgi:hypothetical protein
VAEAFHNSYERLAPDFGYKTREASAVPWEDVPEQNRSLMVAVAAELLAAGFVAGQAAPDAEIEGLKNALAASRATTVEQVRALWQDSIDKALAGELDWPPTAAILPLCTTLAAEEQTRRKEAEAALAAGQAAGPESDLRLYLRTALRMLGDKDPRVVGTPWWEGASAVVGIEEDEEWEEIAPGVKVPYAPPDPPIAGPERRKAQRRGETNTARSESLPHRRSWKDRRKTPFSYPSAAAPEKQLRERLIEAFWRHLAYANEDSARRATERIVDAALSTPSVAPEPTKENDDARTRDQQSRE